MAADLIDRPVVPAPAVDAVAVRAAVYVARQRRQARVLALAIVPLLVLSVMQVAAHGGGTSRVEAAGPAGEAADSEGLEPGPTPSTTAPGATSTTTVSRPAGQPGIGVDDGNGGMTEPLPPGPDLRCAAGRNGGATDVGVTGSKVRLFLPVSGGASADGAQAVRASVDRFNREGGMCGRTLELVAADAAPTDYADQVFASLATPLHAATDQALAADAFDRSRLPIVGLDGLSSVHYSSPWAWPVGTSAGALTRIALHQAHGGGARTFAVVYDKEADWGAESAAAFAEYVKVLGGTLKASIGLDPAQNSYASEVNDFNNRCGGESCDLVLLALLPDTAERWMAGSPARPRLQSAGLPMLLHDRFAQRCAQVAGAACDELMVWDPFKPPIGRYSDEPAVAEYREDSGGDVSPLVESAAVGVRVLVDALRRMGPNVTRGGLAAVLNNTTIDVGLSSPLRWTAADRHGNRSALGLTLQVAGGAFTGWKDAGTGWLADPRPR